MALYEDPSRVTCSSDSPYKAINTKLRTSTVVDKDPIGGEMGRNAVEEHVVKELKKFCIEEEGPNKAEGLLLSCLYQELLNKVLRIAQAQAVADGSREIKPYHVDNAVEIVMGS